MSTVSGIWWWWQSAALWTPQPQLVGLKKKLNTRTRGLLRAPSARSFSQMSVMTIMLPSVGSRHRSKCCLMWIAWESIKNRTSLPSHSYVFVWRRWLVELRPSYVYVDKAEMAIVITLRKLFGFCWRSTGFLYGVRSESSCISAPIFYSRVLSLWNYLKSAKFLDVVFIHQRTVILWWSSSGKL